MAYDLGIDLGGTSVAAAVSADSRVTMVSLGDGTTTVPAVVFLEDDGTLIAGAAATRRAPEHPDRVVRDLRRRLGGSTPVQLGGTPHAPAALLGALLQEVATRVAESVGSKPERVLLTHPAHWSPARREAFGEAIGEAGLPDVRTATEPEAVAAHYALAGRIDAGDTVAVYDLGGSSFTASVLRRTSAGIELLGLPEGVERLGGGTFDEAILSHVNRVAGGPLAGLDRRNPEHVAAVAQLRQDCLLAKQALSEDSATTIPVRLPNRQAEVPLTRAEFEQMIRTAIETTVGAVLKALQSAQLDPAELAAVLLVGGSARIPLVARMVTEVLARPTVRDPDPNYPVALGAAVLAAVPAPADARTDGPADPPAPTEPEAVDEPARPVEPAAAAATEPAAVLMNDGASRLGRQAGDLFTPGAGGSGPELPRRTRAAAAAAAPAAGSTSLFEPRTAVDALPVTAPVPTTAAMAGFAPTRTAPAGFAPERSLPDSLVGTTAIPTPRDATAAAGWPAGDSALDPSTHTTGRIAITADTPPDAPPRSAAPAAGRPRRGLALLVALALVALAGVGYVVWERQSTAQPAAAAAPDRPATAPAASVPDPAVRAIVRVGDSPGFVVVSPDGRRAMVANQTAGTITVLDTATNAVTGRIPVPTGPPQYLTFSPDGGRVYVSIWDKARTVAAVGVLDTATNAVVATIPVRTRPFLAAVTPDGKRLYVPNHDSGTISVIDTTTDTVATEIKVAPNPHWIEMSSDGTRAFVANHESNVVSVIDTSDDSILAEVPVQISPHSLAVRPNRSQVANVNYDSASVTVIDSNRDAVVATIPVGTNPQDITWAPDGRHAYVANTTDGTVSVIDGDTDAVTTTVRTGGSPTSIAVLPDGSAAYVSNLDDGTLTVLAIAG